jgi:hypothetical protein
VKVHATFLADEARVRDGLVYAMGAFPESWDLPSVPANTRLTLVVVFQLGTAEAMATEPHDIAVEVWQDGSHEEVATATIQFGRATQSVAGVPNFRSVVIPFVVELRAAGPCEVHLVENGATLATVAFVVRSKSTAIE